MDHHTHHTPGPDDRFAMPWSLDADDPEPEPTGDHQAVEVIDLTDATHEVNEDAHCPACGSTRIDTATTPAGDRYDRCLACGRLWHVWDGTRELVIRDPHHRSLRR